MWSEFFIACLVGLAVLLVPGYLLLRITGRPRGAAVCVAPLFSSVLLSFLSLVFDEANIPAGPMTVVVIPVAVLVIGCIWAKSKKCSSQGASRDIDVRLIALYALVGLAVGMYIFVKQIDGPLSYTPNFDQIHHLNGVRAFAESERFSFLHNSTYTYDEIATVAPFVGTGFYPSSWHVFCALLVQALGIQPTMAINVINYLFSSVVFPLSMLAMLDALFSDRKSAMMIGAVACISFVSYPWLYLVWGPLFPNMASYALVPSACAFFIRLFDATMDVPERRNNLLLFILGFVGVALAHPNGVFVIAVMLGSYMIQAAFAGDYQAVVKISTGSKRADGLALTGFFAVLWFAVCNLPFLSGVINFVWASYQTPADAVVNYVLAGSTKGFFGPSGYQLPLAFLLILGVIASFKEKRARWAVQAYLFWGIAFVMASSTENRFTHLIAGFWYSDPTRITAAAVLVGVPMAAIGFCWFCAAIRDLFELRGQEHGEMAGRVFPYAAAALFCILTFAPTTRVLGIPFDSSIGQVRSIVRALYWVDSGRLSSSERAFLDEVAEIIPDGAIVANNPCDGSLFAYGASDVHVVYRQITGFDSEKERDASVLIRNSLDEYATNEAVQEAVESIGVEYVLQLSSPEGLTDGLSIFVDDGSQGWSGIMSIDETTPGFTLVLEEGDMRLFELDKAS